MKILLHINNRDLWPVALENLMNTLKYEKEYNVKINVEILVNGNAVVALKKETEQTELYKVLTEAKTNGVDIVACNNALNKFKIGHAELYPFVRVVPAGIIELAEKQNAGYAYIKP